MIPGVLVQIAMLIIIVRCAYVGFTLLQRVNKNWLDILFYASIIVLMLSLLF